MTTLTNTTTIVSIFIPTLLSALNILASEWKISNKEN